MVQGQYKFATIWSGRSYRSFESNGDLSNYRVIERLRAEKASMAFQLFSRLLHYIRRWYYGEGWPRIILSQSSSPVSLIFVFYSPALPVRMMTR